MTTETARSPFVPVANPPSLSGARVCRTDQPVVSRRSSVTSEPLLAGFQVSGLVKRFVAWSLGSVLLAIAVDVLLREMFPWLPVWSDVYILAGVTAPLLALGGIHFVNRAVRQEKALHRRDVRRWVHARRDPLTLADNRQALTEVIGRLNQEHAGVCAALFVLDLHEFQRVNDACGHRVGDAVLRETCRRLRSVLFAHRPQPCRLTLPQNGLFKPRVVRVGSDELALWFPDWSMERSSQPVALDMLAVLDAPFEVEGLKLNLRGSVGYVVDSTGRLEGSDWLTRANAATQQAKRLGEGHALAFDHDQIAAMVRRHGLQQALQEAVKTGAGFRLEFQPIVSLELRTLMGCEALLRWDHPEWGPVSPAEFIPVAEGSDLIRHIGRWVLNEAVKQMAIWQQRAPLSAMLRMKMSVNLSRAQLHDPGLVPFVEKVLREHQVPVSSLRLEVTESLPLDDATSLAALGKLRALGVPLALDDFGTGYSSLSALLNLPLRSVKIDRQFVTGIDRCIFRQTLVSGVVKVADVMGLEVVAEGIEHEVEADMLRALGCHHMQGWLVSRALVAEDFTAQWLQSARPNETTHQAAVTDAAVPL